MSSDPRKSNENKQEKDMERAHREIMRISRVPRQDEIRPMPSGEPSALRYVETVTTYGAYQEPI